MTDSEIFTLLVGFLDAQIPNYGLTIRADDPDGIEVIQGYQQLMQGAPTGASVILHKLPEQRYGFPERRTEWDAENDQEVLTEGVQMMTPVQVTCFGEVNGFTDSDLANTMAIILQSQAFIDAALQAGAGMLRVTEIRQTYFKDDHDQYAQSSSFDIFLTHRRVHTSIVPVADSINSNITRV